MTAEDYYIGEFLIQIFHNLKIYQDMYDRCPQKIIVDKAHFAMIERCPYGAWIEMFKEQGISFQEHPEIKGSFHQFR